MEFITLARSRRSIRKFTDRPVDDGMINLLLEAARWAPSAGNLQSWHFYTIRDERLRQVLGEKVYPVEWFKTAPVILVICAEPERAATRYAGRGRKLYCLQDTAAAIQNILLCAHSLELGTCWLGAFNEEACSEVLSLPPEHRPIALIPVGWPAETPEPRSRRPMEEIITRM